ncbi:MAG: hypothetical protein IMF09_08015 [Proteobacteria bacterium]|nr:hypothetical protein [Pseudomonadota bacterium]
MKILLKGLLYTGLLLVVIYAASPFWISHLLSNQLPPGWEFEELDIDYPGISGININSLRLKGNTLATTPCH